MEVGDGNRKCVIERGSLIRAYDENGHSLFSKARGNGPNEWSIGEP
jgi:hypothetical protein